MTLPPQAPITEDELSAWWKMHVAASRGPWKVEVGAHEGKDWLVCSFGDDGDDGKSRQVTTDGARADDLSWASDDAALVAMAREALPRLVMEVRRLRHEIECRDREDDGDDMTWALGEAITNP